MDIIKDLKNQTCIIKMSMAQASALVFALDEYSKNPNSEGAANLTKEMFKELVKQLEPDIYGFIDPI